MTEREIDILGFEKYLIDDDGDEDYYYYYDIADGMSLISNCKSEEKGGQWEVCIFDTDPEIVFHVFGELLAFINSMESKIRKKKK